MHTHAYKGLMDFEGVRSGRTPGLPALTPWPLNTHQGTQSSWPQGAQTSCCMGALSSREGRGGQSMWPNHLLLMSDDNLLQPFNVAPTALTTCTIAKMCMCCASIWRETLCMNIISQSNPHKWKHKYFSLFFESMRMDLLRFVLLQLFGKLRTVSKWRSLAVQSSSLSKPSHSYVFWGLPKPGGPSPLTSEVSKTQTLESLMKEKCVAAILQFCWVRLFTGIRSIIAQTHYSLSTYVTEHCIWDLAFCSISQEITV